MRPSFAIRVLASEPQRIFDKADLDLRVAEGEVVGIQRTLAQGSGRADTAIGKLDSVGAGSVGVFRVVTE